MEPSDASYRDRLAQALVELAEVQLEFERERDLRMKTEAVFGLTITSMSDAVVFVDQRGRVARANAAAVRLAGRPEQDLIGQTARDVFGEDVPGTPWEVFERSPSGRLPPFDTVVRSAAGTVPVSVSCSVAQDASGKVVGAIYAARDLTETVGLIHELERAEARWRVLAELGDVLGRVLDPADALPETCRLLQASTGVPVGMVLSEGPLVGRVVFPEAEGSPLIGLVGRPLDRGTALWAAVVDHRTVHAPALEQDYPLLRAEGSSDQMRSAALIPLVARDKAIGAIILYSAEPGGVGERVVVLVEQAARRVALNLANAELREALGHMEAEQEAARFREEIIAGVSHDMQTPVAMIQAAIQALQAADVEPGDRERLHAGMARHIGHLRRLVRQFLDFTRLEAGRPIVVRLGPTDVAEAIAASRELTLRQRIQIDVEDDLPAALADRDRLDQLLGNLLSNALKFSPPGASVTVTGWATETTVQIAVSDQGPGISPGALAHLFEKFHRGSDAASTPGTGLGLYMSRALVEAQGGRITVASRLGEGSTFTIELPRAPITASARRPQR